MGYNDGMGNDDGTIEAARVQLSGRELKVADHGCIEPLSSCNKRKRAPSSKHPFLGFFWSSLSIPGLFKLAPSLKLPFLGSLWFSLSTLGPWAEHITIQYNTVQYNTIQYSTVQ